MEEYGKTDMMRLQSELASGSEPALRKLYMLFGDGLLQFSFAIVHNLALAEEVVADVFIQLWRKRERIMSVENLRWYLYTAAKNISLNYLRKERKMPILDLDTVGPSFYTIDPVAIQHLVANDLLQSITEAINELPPRCRLIYKLVKDDGLGYKEVAELLGISVKTVEHQMGIALKKMHKAIRALVPVRPKKQH